MLGKKTFCQIFKDFMSYSWSKLHSRERLGFDSSESSDENGEKKKFCIDYPLFGYEPLLNTDQNSHRWTALIKTIVNTRADLTFWQLMSTKIQIFVMWSIDLHLHKHCYLKGMLDDMSWFKDRKITLFVQVLCGDPLWHSTLNLSGQFIIFIYMCCLTIFGKIGNLNVKF